jgi:hypothetical protein
VPGSSDVSLAAVLLTEYERVKDEQRARIGFRDNLIYATLAAMALVVAAALRKDDQLQLLTLLPPVSLLLGWTYLVNDEKISAIGRYVGQELGPRLATHVPNSGSLFAWEIAHRSDRRRTSRKYLQLVIDLLMFCGAPLAALTVYWMHGPWSLAVVGVSVAETVAIVVLGVQIALYADMKRGAS